MKSNNPLLQFIKVAANDPGITPTHISLFVAIYYKWLKNQQSNEVIISRHELMEIARIKSTATYHKCLKDLQRANYIDYFPSYDYYKGSRIVFKIGVMVKF